MRRLSIRLRLTLWYTFMLAVTLGLFGALLYASYAQTLAGVVDRSLADRGREVNAAVRVAFTPLRPPRLAVPNPNVYATADTFVQIDLLDGELVARSANLGSNELPIDNDALEKVRVGGSVYQTVEVGGERLRVLYRPLALTERPDASEVLAVIQVARPLGPVDETLIGLRLLLTFGSLIALLVSAVVGWLLARAALRPVNRLSKTAEAIGASQDLSQRVDYSGPQDEIGRLATTFNGMLERLQAAYRQIEASLASQRRFVADASHELRTPLTTIRGNASLLSQVPEMSAEDRDATIAQIVGESERMSRLVQDLLLLARADAGQHLNQKPVALRPIVEDVVRQGRVLAHGAHIGLGAVEEVGVTGDPDAIRQLLLILVENAIKYTPAGGKIRIDLRREGEQAMIEVSDTGLGIAAEDLPHIFERFYRADRARQTGGTGLGLSIARWITEEHHGELGVESQPGVGSTFRIKLPVRQSAPVPVAASELPVRGEGARPSTTDSAGSRLSRSSNGC